MEAIPSRHCSACICNLFPILPYLCLSFFDNTLWCSNACGCSGMEGADRRYRCRFWPSDQNQTADERWESRLSQLYCSFAWRDRWTPSPHLSAQSLILLGVEGAIPFLRFEDFQDTCSLSLLFPWRVPSNQTWWYFQPWNTCSIEWCSFSNPICKLSRSIVDIFSSCDRFHNQDIATCTANNTNARILLSLGRPYFPALPCKSGTWCLLNWPSHAALESRLASLLFRWSPIGLSDTAFRLRNRNFHFPISLHP